MRAFRIGFILTLSLLIILTVITLTLGFFPAPAGPKTPEYPSYSSQSSSRYNSDEYKEKAQQYQEEMKKYQDEQENFVKDKVIPYARNVFVSWIVLLLVFQVIGLVLSKFGSALVGAAYAFSGVWAILFGPIGGITWFVTSLISSFSGRSEETFSVDPIFQAVGITCLIGVAVLTILGVIFYGKISLAKSETISDPIDPPDNQTFGPLVPSAVSQPLSTPQPEPPSLAPTDKATTSHK